MDEEIERTVRIKLDVPDERRADLKRTTERFLEAAQTFIDEGWNGDLDTDPITARSHLHSLAYADVREQTGLHSDLCIGAENHAAGVLSSIDELIEDGEEPSRPTFTARTVVYNTNAVSYFDGYCTLAAYGGRVRAEYIVPPGGYPQFEHMDAEVWEPKGATLHYRHEDDAYYLHVTVVREKPTPKPEAENGTVLGVDLGVKNIAVTSTGRFFSGDLLNHHRDEYERRRGAMQQVGTESAHWTIQSMGDRVSRWNRDLLHQISKAIVHEAIAFDCSVVAFEQLNGIRQRMSGASKFQQWAFRQVCEYVEYKAEAHGIEIETVKKNPAYTSQRCSRCGFTHPDNRPYRNGQAEFCCLKCEYEVHADYNAAKNVGMKQVRSGQMSSDGWATNHLALKSGTVNGNGEFSPASS